MKVKLRKRPIRYNRVTLISNQVTDTNMKQSTDLGQGLQGQIARTRKPPAQFVQLSADLLAELEKVPAFFFA